MWRLNSCGHDHVVLVILHHLWFNNGDIKTIEMLFKTMTILLKVLYISGNIAECTAIHLCMLGLSLILSKRSFYC